MKTVLGYAVIVLYLAILIGLAFQPAGPGLPVPKPPTNPPGGGQSPINCPITSSCPLT